jgi:carbamoyl-phosphate synthase large subunit
MNVLITSASRKVSLVQAFQRAVAAEGGGRVVAADCESATAAFFFADAARVLPRSVDRDYWPALLRLCHEEQIGLLVPTRDEELPGFAERRAELAAAGVTVAISPPAAVRLCQDKVEFARFCLENGFEISRVLSEAELLRQETYPVFARTRVGKKSSGAFRVGTPAELAALRSRHGEMLVQELVEAPEYTLDVLADLEGRVLSVVPRVRQAIVGGESYVSATVRAPVLLETGARESSRPSCVAAAYRSSRSTRASAAPRRCPSPPVPTRRGACCGWPAAIPLPRSWASTRTA